MNLNNFGKLNTEERIGFFDIKAIENRLRVLESGKAIKISHGLYGEVLLSMNDQCNMLYCEGPDTVSAEEFIIWGYGEDWQAVDKDYIQKQKRIKLLREELDRLESSL